MRRFASLLSLSLLGLAAFAPAASAQRSAEGVRSFLDTRDDQVKAVLGTRTTFTPQQRTQLQTLINGAIDFSAMGQTALGATWTTLTPAQRTQFTTTFAEIVRNQSLADLTIYRASVRYGDATLTGNTAIARTTTTVRGTSARVDYSLAWSGSAWRITDITIDGVSTAGSYQRQFGQVVRQRGFDGLMTALNRRLASQRRG